MSRDLPDLAGDAGLSAPVPVEGGAILLHRDGHLVILTGTTDATGLDLPQPLPAAPLPHLPLPPAGTEPTWHMGLSCAGRRMRLNCWGRGMIGLRRRLRPLGAGEGPAAGTVDHVLDLVTGPDGQGLYIDGVLVEAVADRAEAAGLAYVRILELAMQPQEPLLVAHAAGLVVNGRPLLLVGPSGMGKTCLSATLMTRGALLLSDDTVAVARGGHGLHGLPVTMRFRPAGWALVGPRLRPGTPPPRYLPRGIATLAPEHIGAVSGPTGPAAAVILLQRQDGVQTALSPVSPAEGMAGLIAAGASITGRADADLCGELAQWASATRFFRLCYDGLQAGAECLEAMGEGSR